MKKPSPEINISKKKTTSTNVADAVKRSIDGGKKFSYANVREIVEAYGEIVSDLLTAGYAVPLKGLGDLTLSILPVKQRTFQKGMHKYNFLMTPKLRIPGNRRMGLRNKFLEHYSVSDTGEVISKDKELEAGNRLPGESDE